MQLLEDLLSTLAVQVGRCEDVIHREKSAWEAAISMENEQRRQLEVKLRSVMDDIVHRMPQNFVSRSELESECACIRQQVREPLSAQMGQVEAQLGDLVGNMENLCRELRNEEQA